MAADLRRRAERAINDPMWRSRVRVWTLWVTIPALFPRLAYRARWPTRLGPRGLLTYAAFNTLFLFLIRQYAVPAFRRAAEERRLATEALTRELDREPTETELHAYLGNTCRL